MKTWVKLYTEILDDPDQGTLTLAQRGVWSLLLALAGKVDDRDAEGNETGRLDTLPRVAWMLRCSEAEIAGAVEAFAARGMVDVREGEVLYLTHYASRQAHMSDAERKRRQRERDRRAVYYDTGRDGSNGTGVTPCDEACHAPVTRRDTDTDTDTEREIEGEESERPLPGPPADGGEHAGPSMPDLAAVYAEVMGVRPNETQVRLMQRHVSDVELFRRCLIGWRERGYSPRNADGVVDWYRKGGPPAVGRRGRDSPREMTPEEREAAAERNRQAIEQLEQRRAAQAWARAQEALRAQSIAGPFAEAQVIGLTEDGQVMVELHPDMLATLAGDGKRAMEQVLSVARQCGVLVELEPA